jgi:hypothetical protein
MTFSRPSLKFAFASLAKIARRSPPAGDKRGGGKKITLAAEGNKKKRSKDARNRRLERGARRESKRASATVKTRPAVFSSPETKKLVTVPFEKITACVCVCVWKGKLCGRCEEIPSKKQRKNFFSPLIFPLNESEPSDEVSRTPCAHTKKKK